MKILLLLLASLTVYQTEPAGGLQCNVGFSYGFEDRLTGDIKYPSEFPIPPKLMDCKTWHDEQMKGRSKMIKDLKEKSKETKNPVASAYIEMTIVFLKKLKPCKDDCLFCATEIDDRSEWVFKKHCYGPNDMMQNFPKNDCKILTPEELTDSTVNRQSNQQTNTKICTCSEDGCNNDPPNETPSEETTETPPKENGGNGVFNPTILKHLFIVSSFFVVLKYY